MKWIAAYLYYAEPWDKLIVEAVKPFADEIMEAGLAEKYFFIRYWELGPHIRLRFYGDDKILDTQVKPKLEAWFTAWLKANPSVLDVPAEYAHVVKERNWYPNNSVQWIEYEPETERYGGVHALPIGESQFQASSDAVLSVMDEAEEWNYDQSLGTAIQMHLAFAHANGMSREEAAIFYSFIFQSWLPMAVPYSTPEEEKQNAMKTVLQAFESQFNEQGEILVPFIDEFWQALEDGETFEEEWVNKWVDRQKWVKAQVSKLDSEGKVTFPDERLPIFERYGFPQESLKYWALYSSYVHMTNNRLGVQNRDEGYLGFLLWKGLELVHK